MATESDNIVFKFKGTIDEKGMIKEVKKITGGSINISGTDNNFLANASTDITGAEVLAAINPGAGGPAPPKPGFGSDQTITDLNKAVSDYTDAITAAKKESERKADASSADAVLVKDATKATVETLITAANDEKIKVTAAVAAANTAADLITDATEIQKAKDNIIKPITDAIAIQDAILDGVVTETAKLIAGGARHRQSRKSKKAGGKKRRKSQRRKQSKQ